MEICLEEPHPREKAPSVIEIKNKIKQGHDECCNCCCCKIPQFTHYRYIQPEIPKPFRPIKCYDRPDIPMEEETTYKLSYWPGPRVETKPILPEGCLTVAEGPFADETTHKMSYLGNWCIKPQEKILPCARSLFGRGPIGDKTTQKCDFTWKYGAKEKPIKYRGNLCMPRGNLDDHTTYKQSYFGANCREPVKSFAPLRCYEKSDVPFEGCTTYKLSFFPDERPEREIHPWQRKPEYHKPTTPLDNYTTYKLSYWPQCCPEQAKPIRQKSVENLLNKDCGFEGCTTYNLSYFGGDGDKPSPIMPSENEIFDRCPAAHDTVNRMSYLGNWCPKPEKPIIPCTRQLLGRGPIADCTTQKSEFTWKCPCDNPSIRPKGNLTLTHAPLECCTTSRLSYMPNCGECLLPNKSYAPIRKYEPSGLPMDLDTTMQLSYQPACEPIAKVEKPWAKQPDYHKPTTKIEDSTTYELSFMAPGMLVPCGPEVSAAPVTNSCSTSGNCEASAQDERPCISC